MRSFCGITKRGDQVRLLSSVIAGGIASYLFFVACSAAHFHGQRQQGPTLSNAAQNTTLKGVPRVSLTNGTNVSSITAVDGCKINDRLMLKPESCEIPISFNVTGCKYAKDVETDSGACDTQVQPPELTGTLSALLRLAFDELEQKITKWALSLLRSGIEDLDIGLNQGQAVITTAIPATIVQQSPKVEIAEGGLVTAWLPLAVDLVQTNLDDIPVGMTLTGLQRILFGTSPGEQLIIPVSAVVHCTIKAEFSTSGRPSLRSRPRPPASLLASRRLVYSPILPLPYRHSYQLGWFPIKIPATIPVTAAVNNLQTILEANVTVANIRTDVDGGRVSVAAKVLV
jgi:hypothetical protein